MALASLSAAALITAPACVHPKPIIAKRITASPRVSAPPTKRPTPRRPVVAPKRIETPRRRVVSAPVGSVTAAILAVFGPVHGPGAVRVAQCESGLRPGVVSNGNYGLMQINVASHMARIRRLGYTVAQMLQLGPNLAVAHDIFLEQGWRPWTCKP